MKTQGWNRVLMIWVAVCLAGCGSGDGDGTGPRSDEPITVTPQQGLTGLSASLDSIRVELRIPGMGAAIGRDGRIVWAEGASATPTPNPSVGQPREPPFTWPR